MFTVQQTPTQHDGLTFEVEMAPGFWRPFAHAALPQLAYDAKIRPDQTVRFHQADVEVTCLASELPHIRYREMLERHYRVISRFLSRTGDVSESIDQIVARGRRLREWCGPEGDTEEKDASKRGEIDADSAVSQETGRGGNATRAMWFRNYLDFAEAVLWGIVGADYRAEPLYQRIVRESPDGTNGALWLCAMHQLACMHIADGREDGLASLCELVDRGAQFPHVRSGPTDYVFAEMLRYFDNHGRPHPLVTKTLQHEAVRKLWSRGAPPKGADDANGSRDWRQEYRVARQVFRARARDCGLGLFEDFDVLWPTQPPPWEARGEAADPGPIRCGLLAVLGAQDIQENFGLVTIEQRARHRHLRGLLEEAQRMELAGQWKEALALLVEVGRAAGDDEEVSTLAAEARRWTNNLRERIEAARHEQRLAADQALLQRVRELDGLDVDDAQHLLARIRGEVRSMPADQMQQWVPLLQAAEAKVAERRGKEQDVAIEQALERIGQLCKQNLLERAELELEKIAPLVSKASSARRQELLDLLRRLKSEITFQRGLQVMDQDAASAEALLTAAAQADPNYAPFVPALIVASGLYHARVDQQIGSLADLGQYREELRRRVAALMQLKSQDQQAWNTIWELVKKTVENLIACGEPGDPAVATLVESLCTRLERYRSMGDTLSKSAELIDLVAGSDPRQSMIDAVARRAGHRLSLQRLLSDGETARAANQVEPAAAKFREAIREDPNLIEAWHKLIDCRVEQQQVPMSWKQRWVRELGAAIESLDQAAREQYHSRPDEWIDEQIRQRGAGSNIRMQRRSSRRLGVEAGRCWSIQEPRPIRRSWPSGSPIWN